jgi:hypothetical protein
VEDQVRRGWADIRLAETPDVVGLQRLTRVIGTAQRQRVEREQPALLAAATKLDRFYDRNQKRLRAVLDTQFRHLASGRGLALVR